MSFEDICAALDGNNFEAVAVLIDALEFSMDDRDATIAMLRHENALLSEENKFAVDRFHLIETLGARVAVRDSEIVSLKREGEKKKAAASKVESKLHAEVDTLKRDNAAKDAQIAAMEKKNIAAGALVRKLHGENENLKKKLATTESAMRGFAAVSRIMGGI